jgi:hypothetical protein
MPNNRGIAVHVQDPGEVWATVTAYVEGDRILVTWNDLQLVVTPSEAGNSGAVEPVWEDSDGFIFPDDDFDWWLIGVLGAVELSQHSSDNVQGGAGIIQDGSTITVGGDNVGLRAVEMVTIATPDLTVTVDGFDVTASDHFESSIKLDVPGIGFPATQAPDAGANVLDDYEENSFTPGMSFGGGTTGITYGTQVGRYTKIGNLVSCQGQVILTSNGSSTGDARITGLPFASQNTAGLLQSASVSKYANLTLVTQPLGWVEPNTTAIVLHQEGVAASVAITEANVADTAVIAFSVAYMV